jgi:hypothetical protein
MTSKEQKSLVYHCPDHPDRAPFCAIGDYTPCRECYQKFRNLNVPKDGKTIPQGDRS